MTAAAFRRLLLSYKRIYCPGLLSLLFVRQLFFNEILMMA